MAIDYSFLSSGSKWAASEIHNLTFNFAEETPLYVYIQPQFYQYFESIGGLSLKFSAFSNPDSFDQRDAVRYFLCDSGSLSAFAGVETINTILVNTAAAVSGSDITRLRTH